MGQFQFIYKEVLTDLWKKNLIFPVFKEQEFIADERNLSGNTFPREQKCIWHHCLLQEKEPPYRQGSQHLLEMANYIFFLVQ